MAQDDGLNLVAGSQSPRVSIGLPVFNGDRYLQGAIDSLLAQTFSDFELILSDNASTDGTEEICRRAASRDRRVRYFRNPTNIGSHPNHNRVLELSTGEYFRWAGYDDLVEPTFLEHCVSVLDGDPSVVLCFSLFDLIDADGRVVGFSEPPPPRFDAPTPHGRLRMFWQAPSVHQVIYGLIRRAALQRVPPMGGWYAADRATLIELALLGGFERIELPLFHHREHALRSQYVDRRSYWSPTTEGDDSSFGYWRRLGYMLTMLQRHRLPLTGRVAILGEFMRFGARRIPHWGPELAREVLGGLRRGAAISFARLRPGSAGRR